MDLVLFVTIRAPKMRRITAKRSYTRVDHPGFVEFADAYVALHPATTPVFGGNYAQFRNLFRVLAAELGIPVDARWP